MKDGSKVSLKMFHEKLGHSENQVLISHTVYGLKIDAIKELIKIRQREQKFLIDNLLVSFK